MRQITKDIQINMDGNRIGFRLSKLDAFSGVMLLRLLMRLEDHQKCHPEQAAAQSKDLIGRTMSLAKLPGHIRDDQATSSLAFWAAEAASSV